VLARWSSDDDDRLVTVAEQLRELGLTWKVEARRLDDTRLELRVARTHEPQRGGTKDLVNVADVGFGVSQVLPVLVALLVAKPGDIVHIEQPEIHLHPAAQARLAQPLAAAAKRGVIVVAETHSPLLLRAVQQLVADGTLPARDVALHWFRLDDTGATQVTTAELHPDGTYGDWPEDFASTEMDLEIQLLAAMAGE
jgi:predicted ATPase